MKRNTALYIAGALATLFIMDGTSISEQVSDSIQLVMAGETYMTYDELDAWQEANPDKVKTSWRILFGIYLLLALILGKVLVALFGEKKIKTGAKP